MKKIMILCVMAAAAITVSAKDIREYVVTTTPVMTCKNCENTIKGNLRFEKGVKNIVTDREHQRVIVTYDAEKTNEAKLAEAFRKIHYSVKKINDNDSTKQTISRGICH